MIIKDKNIKITVDEGKCVKCGKCVDICFGHLEMIDNQVKPKKDSLFGCIQCGNCMILCPEDCISVDGSRVSKEKVSSLIGNNPEVDALFHMFRKRRSIRKFKDHPVEKETIEKILDAGTTAPVGLPPSDVKVLVFNGKNKVQAFADDLCGAFEEMLKVFNPIVLASLRPFLGKVNYEIYKEFIIPVIKFTLEQRKEGKDMLFYGAPVVMLFYGGKYTVMEDGVLAAAYSQITAESLGLGSCFIGSLGPTMSKSKKLRNKYGIEKTDNVYIGFILGHPVTKFKKSIKRDFLDVKYV